MAGDDPKPITPSPAPAPPPPRRGPIRTAPLEDSDALRVALKRELQKRAAPSLLIISGPDVGLRVRLDRSLDVGRDPASSFALRDQNISWHHLRIENRGAGEWVVVDLGSTNGTVVNAERIAGERALKAGDRVLIGKTVLEYQVVDGLREEFNAEVQRLLNEDELSGLWVKRRFDGQLATCVSAVVAASSPVVSVIVMDLDGVKGINDTHGHDMGAFVIGEAGRVIGRVIGARGFATRFGGDEFAAALPGIAKADAAAIAEEVRVAVVSHGYEKRGIRVHPGLSAGVASLPGDASDAEGLFRAADQAMYRAKRAGKNRVAV
jgi:two-component system, cell cycle response regulator